MFGLGAATRIYLAAGATDMRKGFEGLYGLVRDRLQSEPLSGHIFVFSNAPRNRLKLLFWDGSGLWVCAKRLEKGRFHWPKAEGEKVLRMSIGFPFVEHHQLGRRGVNRAAVHNKKRNVPSDSSAARERLQQPVLLQLNFESSGRYLHVDVSARGGVIYCADRCLTVTDFPKWSGGPLAVGCRCYSARE
jgi:hypothetical protein